MDAYLLSLLFCLHSIPLLALAKTWVLTHQKNMTVEKVSAFNMAPGYHRTHFPVIVTA